MVECQKRLRTGRFKQQPNFKKPPHTSKVALSKCTHPAFLTLPLGITRIETLGSTPRFDPPGGDPPWMTVVSFTAPSWPWWTAATSAWNLEGVIGILSLSVGMVSKRRRTGRLRTYQCAVNMNPSKRPSCPLRSQRIRCGADHRLDPQGGRSDARFPDGTGWWCTDATKELKLTKGSITKIDHIGLLWARQWSMVMASCRSLYLST